MYQMQLIFVLQVDYLFVEKNYELYSDHLFMLIIHKQ